MAVARRRPRNVVVLVGLSSLRVVVCGTVADVSYRQGDGGAEARLQRAAAREQQRQEKAKLAEELAQSRREQLLSTMDDKVVPRS